VKQIFCLSAPAYRRKAREALEAAGDDYLVTIEPPKRSLAQNARLWAMLSEISNQVIWYGQKLSAEEWKHVFTASLRKQKVVPGLDGEFVVLGLSTSKMSILEMNDLQTLIEVFGIEKGVDFKDGL
jgi:hypothetical protein